MQVHTVSTRVWIVATAVACLISGGGTVLGAGAEIFYLAMLAAVVVVGIAVIHEGREPSGR